MTVDSMRALTLRQKIQHGGHTDRKTEFADTSGRAGG
jgi:hypothetical protein